MCFVGCNRPVEVSERPYSNERKSTEQRSRTPSAAASARATSDEQPPSRGAASLRVPACIEGSDPKAPLQERLTTATERCAQGQTATRSPIEWTLGGTKATRLAQLPAGAPRCVHAIVVVSESGHTVQVSLIDGQGRSLASAAADATIVVPEDGPLCVPSEVALEVQIAAENVMLSGMAKVFESP
jgi:hypothetical protein